MGSTSQIEGLLIETIKKACIIIEDGITKRNYKDFETEFLAYWRLNNNSHTYSIFEPKNKIAKIQMASISSGNIKCIIGENEKKINDYLKKIDNKIKITNLESCLYLPFDKIPFPPFPINFKELLTLLNPSHENLVLDFLKNNKYEGIVFFSIRLSQSAVLAGWRHKSPSKTKKRNKAPFRRRVFYGNSDTTENGFRAGHIDKRILRNRLYHQKIMRVNVERIDSNRLQKRIGKDNTIMKNKKICIVGCGSIGSQVIFLLSKLGIEKFALVDNEILEAENISRHLCGMSEIKLEKVYAIKRKIESHFPHISIQAYPKKYQKVFNSNPELFYDADLIISATGDTAIERRLNVIQHDSDSFPPVLHTWIEPFGVASHAILIIKGKGGCLKCCHNEDNLQYKFLVLLPQDESDFRMQEAGCQTTYSPYSALDADQASSTAARLAVKYLMGELTKSTRDVWIGDLGLIDQIGASKNTIYEKSSFYSLSRYHIDKLNNCTDCS